ncbi:DUF2252 domain-containing protein [Kutzneria buriramensis]|nr:DUF2252 domain-containing protein [Kutzneria buriramensis]
MTVLVQERGAVEGVGLSRAERVARGKAARARVPRSSHAEFVRDSAGPSPLELLARQDESRIPDLVPIRYGRMAVSAFTYFRGAALPMAADLAATPRGGLSVQVCGDAHLMNFGVFASPERRLVFDINDFDETLPGPWEWDVKRLAASLEIAGRSNGYPTKRRRGIVVAAVAEYRRAMRAFASATALDVWYAHADVDMVRTVYAQNLSAASRKKLDGNLARVRTKNNLGALRQFTEASDGGLRIVSEAHRVVRVDEIADPGQDPQELRARLGEVLAAYRETLEPERRALLDRYSYVDLARKIVGVGSVGTRCWMVLMLGVDNQDPLFLQAKEAGPSVLEEFLAPSRFDNAGQRVVTGQRLMQTVSDIFLGWVRVAGFDSQSRDFYLRQLRDWKGSAEIDGMLWPNMTDYGRLCGWTLARAHARSGDPIAIGSYLGSASVFDEAVAEFAAAYADQNERDHAALLAAIASGAVRADTDT